MDILQPDSAPCEDPKEEFNRLPGYIKDRLIAFQKHRQFGKAAKETFCDRQTMQRTVDTYGDILYRMFVSFDERPEIQIDSASETGVKSVPVTITFGYVYLLKAFSGTYKIGKSKHPESRIRKMNVVLPFDVEVEHLIECEDYTVTERKLHDRYASKHIRGEWYSLSDEDVVEIKSIQKDMRGAP